MATRDTSVHFLTLCTPNLRKMPEGGSDETAVASAKNTPKAILVHPRVSAASNSNNQTHTTMSARKSTPSVAANAQKTQFRRDAKVAPADQYKQVCADMNKLRQELKDLKRSIHGDAQGATRVVHVKKAGVLKDNKTPVPSSWYCSYVYDDDTQKKTEPATGLHSLPNAKILSVDDLLIITQLCNTHTMPGFVSLHRSSLDMDGQGKNTENVLYAGLLHFPVPWLAQTKIAASIALGMSPTQLLDTHPEFASAKKTAFLLCDVLQAKTLDPVCWCTGADGFCVAWFDPACFLRHKKHKVQVRTRSVDIFLQTYLDAPTYAAIVDKFDLFSGILNIQHAALCSYRCLTSPSEATPLQSVEPQELPPNLTQEMILRTKLAAFWNSLLTKIPATRDSIAGLPMAIMPKATVDEAVVPKAVSQAGDVAI